jgi:NADH-quinone oxidoreductase subunit J
VAFLACQHCSSAQLSPSSSRPTFFTPSSGWRWRSTGTAGVFLLLDAEFLAAVQLLLYAGGVITIVVFAIVVTERLVGRAHFTRPIDGSRLRARCAALLWLIVTTVMQRPLAQARPSMDGDLTRMVGESVLTRLCCRSSCCAVLMLAGLLGAIYFARPEEYRRDGPCSQYSASSSAVLHLLRRLWFGVRSRAAIPSASCSASN